MSLILNLEEMSLIDELAAIPYNCVYIDIHHSTNNCDGCSSGCWGDCWGDCQGSCHGSCDHSCLGQCPGTCAFSCLGDCNQQAG